MPAAAGSAGVSTAAVRADRSAASLQRSARRARREPRALRTDKERHTRPHPDASDQVGSVPCVGMCSSGLPHRLAGSRGRVWRHGAGRVAQKWGPPARRHLAAAQRWDAPVRCVEAVPARVGRAAARPSRASLQRQARCGGGGGGTGTRACCGRRGVRHRKATALRCTSRRHVPAAAQRELGARRELARLVTWRRRDLATGADTHALPNALHRCSMVAECGADAPAPEPAGAALTELPLALIRRIVEVRTAVSSPGLRQSLCVTHERARRQCCDVASACALLATCVALRALQTDHRCARAA